MDNLINKIKISNPMIIIFGYFSLKELYKVASRLCTKTRAKLIEHGLNVDPRPEHMLLND